MISSSLSSVWILCIDNDNALSLQAFNNVSGIFNNFCAKKIKTWNILICFRVQRNSFPRWQASVGGGGGWGEATLSSIQTSRSVSLLLRYTYHSMVLNNQLLCQFLPHKRCATNCHFRTSNVHQSDKLFHAIS